MFNHVVLYKDSLEPVFIREESELNRSDIYVIIDNEIAKYKRENFEYILSYDRTKDAFVIGMKYIKDNVIISEKYFHNFEYALQSFKDIQNH